MPVQLAGELERGVRQQRHGYARGVHEREHPHGVRVQVQPAGHVELHEAAQQGRAGRRAEDVVPVVAGAATAVVAGAAGPVAGAELGGGQPRGVRHRRDVGGGLRDADHLAEVDQELGAGHTPPSAAPDAGAREIGL
ncbi:hypothetical protein Asp14428_09570 [Actinoplanes sp. NBRC 14428]|nr:hypothetical protein Asp14428_09570 [Actinoplanes sp. NBRC 14428]